MVEKAHARALLGDRPEARIDERPLLGRKGIEEHGGGLATDQPESPHLLIAKTKARFLVAIARNDDEKEPKTKDILRDAFAKAGRAAEVEVYPAMHGWCPPDSAVYDAAQAEKAWGRMMALFKETLV